MHRNRYALLGIELSCYGFVLYSPCAEKRIAFFRRQKSVSGGGWSLATRPKLELFIQYSIQFGIRFYLLTIKAVRDDG